MGIEWLDDSIDDESRWTQGMSKLKPEDRLQRGLMNWLQYKYPAIKKMTFASAGGIRTWGRVMADMKKTGYQPGTFDLNIAVARQGFHGLFLEVKPLRGVASPAQKEYGVLLRKEGYCARIEKGWKRCREAIEDYLNESVPFDYAEAQPVPTDQEEISSEDEVLVSAFDAIPGNEEYILPGEKPNLSEAEKRIKAAIFRGIHNAKDREAKIAQYRKGPGDK